VLYRTTAEKSPVVLFPSFSYCFTPTIMLCNAPTNRRRLVASTILHLVFNIEFAPGTPIAPCLDKSIIHPDEALQFHHTIYRFVARVLSCGGRQAQERKLSIWAFTGNHSAIVFVTKNVLSLAIMTWASLLWIIIEPMLWASNRSMVTRSIANS
jgi:hypothetical protein